MLRLGRHFTLILPIAPVILFSHVFLHFRQKEATGIPLLGTVLVEFAVQLADRSSVVYRVDMEFPVVVNAVKRGQKPACDGALCAILASEPAGQPESGDDTTPVVLYEYKPTVDTRCDTVNPDDLLELVIQGYYCLRQYNLRTLLHCLTDLQQWYYFKLTYEHSQVKCMWFKDFHSESPDDIDIASHVNFLDHWVVHTDRA